jgi:uncharacterized membrane protein
MKTKCARLSSNKTFYECVPKLNFMIETRKRSFVKSIIWRIICVAVSIITAFFLTGKIDVSVAIGTIYNAITMILYYFHERFWNIIEWGKTKINHSF